MNILLKNGQEIEIPQDWIDEWNKVYYDVPRTLADIRIWCLDNPSKRKTKRGLRAFVGRWIRKACVVRPLPMDIRKTGDEEGRGSEIPLSLEKRLSRLAELKAAIK